MNTTTTKKVKAAFIVNGERASVELDIRPAQRVAPMLTIDFEPVSEDAIEFSITGTCSGSAGQCTNSIRELGADVPDIVRLCDIWDRWHLNGLKAGSRAQLECLEAHEGDPLKSTTTSFYEHQQNILKEHDLLKVPTPPGRGSGTGMRLTYKYGAAWLFEPVPESIIAETIAILERIKGKRFGHSPDVSDAPDVDGDIFDSRDAIKRLEIYRDAVESLGIDPDTRANDLPEDTDEETRELVEELNALTDLESEAGGGDWNYGVTFINDSYFETYAEELADDIGAIDRNSRWPNNHIDWKAAAEELQHDYSSVEFRGETYWYR